MCAALGFIEIQDWLNRYEAENPRKIVVYASYNIRPGKEALTIIRRSPNRGELMKFAFKAPWNEKLLLINAKAENLLTSRVWRSMFRENRCLVPVSFWYEWQVLREEKMKQPWAFGLRSGEPFAFAGLYTEANEFVIITTEPKETFFSAVHPRQPVGLSREAEKIWLDPDATEEQLLSCLAPQPAEIMKKWRISSLVNKAANDFPEIIKEAL